MALSPEQRAKLVKLGQLAKFKELADARYQLIIDDLSTIRSGAAAGATAYQLPQNGIPSTDLAQAVQDALTAAGTALQASDLNELNGKVAALEALISEDEDPTAAIDKFNEIVAFLAGITNTETLDGILGGINDAISAKYTKPGTGIPASDLSDAVQASLALADSALQSHQDISGKADKDTDAVAGNIAEFDSNGNPVDSGHALSEYKTKQTAVTDPTASGTAVSFIDSFAQDANGDVTVTKKTVANVVASTNGAGGSNGLMTAAQAEKLGAIEYADDTDIAALF